VLIEVEWEGYGMRAAVCTGFGTAEVVQVKEVETPTPKDSEVLIRIHATTVAIEDADIRRSGSLSGRGKGKETILGTCLAGEIEAVGEGVGRFKEGDRVYGFTGFFGGMGTHAEYATLPESGCLAAMPANMTYEEAAAIPDGGLTALPFLRDRGRIRSGQRVLINGASGAVGTAAVQIARAFGAEVTGVCSTANLDLVRSLGADHVVDYTVEDFTRSGETYDVIFDAVGKSSFSRCRGSLTQRGIYLTTVPMPATLLQMLLTSLLPGQRARFMATGLMAARKKRKDLVYLTELIEAGKLKAVIDRVYPLNQIVEAHRYVEKGHKKGNVVITVEHDSE
jgi:NADPH:quinone reductase-like Zn-dependent oxidoreductase